MTDTPDPIEDPDDGPILIPEVMDAATAAEAGRAVGAALATAGTTTTEALEGADQASAALEAAARYAMKEPGIAGRDEFLSLCLQARMLSMSDLAPRDIRGKPYNALLILMTARDLGIPPTAALRKVRAIEGQPSLDTQLLTALVRRQGLGQVKPVQENFSQKVPTWAGAVAVGPDGQLMGPMVVFTWQDAVDAELVDPTCQPGAHNVRRMSGQRRDGSTWNRITCGCKDNWQKNLRDMLWWRAAARACRFYFPEVGLGLYSPDELGYMTDDDGQIIDPTTVELPAGFEDPQARQQQTETQQDALADPADLWQLQLRIRALPPQLRGGLKSAWAGGDSRLKGYPAAGLPRRLLGNAKGMVNAWEAQARSAGIDLQAEQEAVLVAVAQRLLPGMIWGWNSPPPDDEPATAPQEAPDSPEPDPGPDTAEDTPEASTGDPGAGSDDLCEYADHSAELATDGRCTYCGATTEAHDAAEAEEKARWREEMASLSTRVKKAAEGVPPEDIELIATEVKALHWSKLNQALTEAGIPTEGHIDLRRMHLALIRIRDLRVNRGMDLPPDPYPTDDPKF